MDINKIIAYGSIGFLFLAIIFLTMFAFEEMKPILFLILSILIIGFICERIEYYFKKNK